jgi:amidohydrolase
MDLIYSHASELFEYTRRLRRDFHRYPELGFQEYRTAGIVARELNQLGVKTITGIAETGVIGLIEGKKPGPIILLRFDMDALPIQEASCVDYASKNTGLMHACGHDGHTAIGLTVARLLHSLREEWSGMVKMVFQPAEEGLGGAKRMIEAGVLESPTPDASLGLHIWNEKPIGWFGITPGPIMAAAEIFRVQLTGKGGHGALPHLAVDPILACAQAVVGLQSVVSRNVSPLDTAVISVTALQSGEAFNIIPSQAEMRGTIRTYTPEVRQRVLNRFEVIIRGTAESFECESQIDLKQLTPAVVNDSAITEQVFSAAQDLFPGAVIDRHWRTMVSEDMAEFLSRAPGCFFFVGSANSEQGLDAPHHHPKFNFDENVLPQAAAVMAFAALKLLGK